MLLRQLFDHESSTYTYLIADVSARQAALVDPVLGQIERDLKLVAELGLELTHVLETHVHADHVTSAGLLRERTGAKTHASASGAPCVDVQLRHGDVVRVGEVVITALATPGHTDDGMCFSVSGHVLTGDTLLIRGCGRADFQNGNPEALFESITGVLFALPDATIVLPAHACGGENEGRIRGGDEWPEPTAPEAARYRRPSQSRVWERCLRILEGRIVQNGVRKRDPERRRLP